MKLSLLDMTQRILSDMDSDEVNSIADTVEATQVASTIRDCYFEMIGNRNWPHLRQLIRLDAYGDPNYPTHMTVPDRVKEISGIKYDKRKAGSTRYNYQEVYWREPEDFLRILNSRNSDNSNVELVQDVPDGTYLFVLNDVAPTYWTSFDDVHVVMDSYDKSVDSTLQSVKTQVVAYVNPEWTHEDDFVPNLPIEAFPALLAEAASTCFFNIKQMPNQKAEQKTSRQQRWLSRKAWKTHGGVRYEDYGRKSRR